MTATHRRIISFAGSSATIEYDGPRAAAIVDFLYRHAPPPSGVPPCTVYRLTPGDQPGWLALYRDDKLMYKGDSEGTLAELLLGNSCYHLAKQSQGGLLFHAAGLAWQGKGLLMPGRIGAGKTTLTAWLVLRGLDYLTDELVFVPHGGDTVQPFTRPLNLKKPSKTALQDYFDFAGQATSMLRSPNSYLIPPELLKPTNKLDIPPLSLIVFPHYVSDGDFVLRPLSRAQAGLALMRCLINARNLVGHGFSEIIRLAKTAPAYHLSYASFDPLGEQIETLLSSAEFVNPELL